MAEKDCALQFLKTLKLYNIASRNSTISIPIKSVCYHHHLQKHFLQKDVTLIVHWQNR